LKKFKVSIIYFGCCCEETIELAADNYEQARKKCLELVEQNHELIDLMAEKNIFISKRIKDCVLHRSDWRDDIAINLEVPSSD
jgi:hypothetical protein